MVHHIRFEGDWLLEQDWKAWPKRVIAPYEKESFFEQRDTRVRRDTWNPVGICEDHLARLNTPQRPIVNKYREGKVKSTPARGVKETLKPSAYKPLEPLPAREGDSVPFA